MVKPIDVINNTIIDVMSQGVLPWERPWVGSERPQRLNLDGTTRSYTGCNVWTCTAYMWLNNWASPYFVTFKQVSEWGGRVKKGEKSIPILFYTWIKPKDAKDDDDRIPLMRYYSVFNTDQCEGIEDRIPSLEKKNIFEPIKAADELLASFKNPPAFRDGQRAAYSPKLDTVTCPPKEQFKTPAGYYMTMFHEYGHATGAENRLKRPGIVEFDKFGSQQYSEEELIAEMTALYAASECGFDADVIENAVAYLQSWGRNLSREETIAGWTKALEDNKYLFVRAGSKAEKALTWMKGGEDDKQQSSGTDSQKDGANVS